MLHRIERVTARCAAALAAGTTGSSAADCWFAGTEDRTGFLNTANIISTGQDREAQAWPAPGAPMFGKRALDLAQHEDADSTWDGSHKCIVTNQGTDGTGTNCTLADTPASSPTMPPPATATSPDVVVNEARRGMESADDVGVADQVLESGTVHTYTVIANVSLSSVINDAKRASCCRRPEPGPRGSFRGKLPPPQGRGELTHRKTEVRGRPLPLPGDGAAANPCRPAGLAATPRWQGRPLPCPAGL